MGSELSWADYPAVNGLPGPVVTDLALPLVSVVTPSYNQGRFIRQTIESVLGQDYPNIEYWVIDGGSTDETVSVIREFEGDPRFHWLSEPDRGQADAINKGWSRCRGDIVAWLNSDDYYVDKAAIRTQVNALVECPDVGLVYGDCHYTDTLGDIVSAYPTRPYSYKALLQINYIPQPTVFIKMNIVQQAGPVDISFRFAMDLDYWLRCSTVTDFCYVPEPIATYRLHGDSKTVSLNLDVNSDAVQAVLKHLASADSSRITPSEKRTIRTTLLLVLAVRAIRAGDLVMTRRLVRQARAERVWNIRYLQVGLALADRKLGLGIEEKLASFLFRLLNPRLKRDRRFSHFSSDPVTVTRSRGPLK